MSRRQVNPNGNPEKSISFKEQWRSLRFLPPFLKMIWETNKGYTVTNILLRIVKAFIPVAMLYTGKLIIDEVAEGAKGLPVDTTLLWILLGTELGFAILSEGLNRAIILVDSLMSDLFANRLSEELITHAGKLDLFYFEDPAFYDKMERARRQTTGRTVLMSQILSQLQDLVSILFLAAGLLVFHPWLLIVIFVAIVPSFLGESHFNQRSYALTHSWTPERRELDYLRYIGASDETAKEIKAFNLSNFIGERFKRIAHDYFLANKKIAIKRAFWGTLLSLIGTGAYYGTYGFLVFEAAMTTISLGTLTFLSGSFARLRGVIQGFMGRFNQITEGAMYLEDLFDFMALEPQGSTLGAEEMPQNIQLGFEFQGVGFKYPNSEKWAVRNVSFILHPGEKLALVGENGAGKTTLVKLLARLYEPTEGRILLEGKDLRAYDLNSLRKWIGIIFQDFYRYQMNTRENVAVGEIDEVTNQSRLETAAHKSLAEEVISTLPEGWNQMLGKRFANGVELSGGQWQKVALARAYMKEAHLYILDEPTSALDARAEFEVFERFAKLIEGKSAVLISHRFSTVRMADRILFLENGGIKEMGTHEELLLQGGKYAELFNLQAQGYLN